MSRNSLTKGFSIIELFVSMAIMLAIIGVVVLNQNQFGSGAALKNISNNLGLALRQAQIYGISVKEFSSGSYQAYTTSSFNAGYGLYFDITSGTGDNKMYIFFGDRKPASPPNANPNGLYGSGISCPLFGTGTPPSECIDKVVLSQGHTISALCTVSGGIEDCTTKTRLDVTFIRPAVEAKIRFNGDAATVYDVACIEVSSPTGQKNAVVVYTTGQISIQTNSCSVAI